MNTITLQDITKSDFDSILQLNEIEVKQTSAMDWSRLQFLNHIASYHKVARVDEQVVAFILAMRAGAAYPNDNFSWFSRRMEDFLYVDRIVVNSKFARLKIGSAMYQDMFFYAREHHIPSIVCEYNIQPPNPTSRAFHNKFGFKEMGTQWVAGGTKLVTMQEAKVEAFIKKNLN